MVINKIEPEYEDYIKSCEQLALAGDVVVQRLLCERFYEGSMVAQDYKEALRWGRMGAEQNDATCQYVLYKIYNDDAFDEANKEAAFDLLKKSAEGGNVDASHEFGMALINGADVDVDYKLAEKYLKYAFDKKKLHFNDLAYLYMINEDAKLFSLCNSYVSTERDYYYGICYLRGIGTKKNYRKAAKYFCESRHEDRTKKILSSEQSRMFKFFYSVQMFKLFVSGIFSIITFPINLLLFMLFFIPGLHILARIDSGPVPKRKREK